MANENVVTLASLVAEKLARMNGVKMGSINMERIIPHIENILETIETRKQRAIKAWKTVRVNKKRHIEAGKKSWLLFVPKRKHKKQRKLPRL